MNSQEVFAKMKEENKAQEEKLAQKIMEGNENLKKTLQKIKKDMEKISLYSNVNYDSFKRDPNPQTSLSVQPIPNHTQIDSTPQNFYTMNQQSQYIPFHEEEQNKTNQANIVTSTSNFKVQNNQTASIVVPSISSSIKTQSKKSLKSNQAGNSINNQNTISPNKSKEITESIKNTDRSKDMPLSKTFKTVNVRESVDSDKDYNVAEIENKLFYENQIPQEHNEPIEENDDNIVNTNTQNFYNNSNTNTISHNINASNINPNNSTGTNILIPNQNVSNNNTTNDFFHNQDNSSTNYNYMNNPNNSNNNIQTTSNFYYNNSQANTGNNFYKNENDVSSQINNMSSYRNNNMKNDSSNQYDSSNNPTKQQFYNNFNSTTKSVQNDNYEESVNNRSESNVNNSMNKSKTSKKKGSKINSNQDEHFLSFKKKKEQNENEEHSVKENSIKPPMKNKNMHNTNKLLKEQREYLKWKNKMGSKKEEINKIQKQNATLSSTAKKTLTKTKSSSNTANNTNKTTTSNAPITTIGGKKKMSFGANEYEDYKIYEKKVLDKMAKEELYADVGTTKDILGEFVDKVIERSLYLYKNRHCHSCARLLSKGESTYNCPKCHHLLNM